MMKKTRDVFVNQPAHAVIIDATPPMSIDVMQSISKKFVEILSISYNVKGGVRIPALGVYCISFQVQPIFKVIQLKENKQLIIDSIRSLSTYLFNNIQADTQEFDSMLNYACSEAVKDFKELFETRKKNFNCPSNLQLTVISAKDSLELQVNLTTMLSNKDDISRLRKVQIINPSYKNTEEDGVKIYGAGEVVEICLSPLSTLLKTWLLDYSNGPDLLLNLPGISLQCDLSECMLNPMSIPYGQMYELKMDSLSLQLGGTSISSSAVTTLPVYELEVIQRLSEGAICETMLFGIPLCISSTKSWQLSIAEQEQNSKQFLALCNTLGGANENLLARRRIQGDNSVTSYFMIVPGDNLMIIKSVVPSELLLPWRKKEPIEGTVCRETLHKVRSSILGLNKMDSYCPSDFTSGLFPLLNNSVVDHSKQNSISMSGDLIGMKRVRKKSERGRMNKKKDQSTDLNDSLHPAFTMIIPSLDLNQDNNI